MHGKDGQTDGVKLLLQSPRDGHIIISKPHAVNSTSMHGVCRVWPIPAFDALLTITKPTTTDESCIV